MAEQGAICASKQASKQASKGKSGKARVLLASKHTRLPLTCQAENCTK
ncbi:MAG: hypothetical protein ACLT3G_01060 [Acutalibacteraceae bacterium]